MEEERALFAAWCAGDKSAGAALFDRHYEPIARYFRNKAEEAVIPDLIQGTFLACLEARERFRGDASFRTFLFAIAHNLLRKHYERQRRAMDSIDFAEVSVIDLAPSVNTGLRIREEQRVLLEALRHLPLECQEVLELHYWDQLGTAEIAEVVGVPEGTVKSRLQRGRRLLKDKLRVLAASSTRLESTLMDLKGWAHGLRDRLPHAP